MATLSNVLSFSRAQAQTDSNGLTDANGIIFANEALLDYRRNLLAAGVDASQLQEAYRDTAANTGTYLYPTDMFWLKAIELNYSNANEQDYITADQIDVANLPEGQSFSWLRKNAATNQPKFDDRGDWYEIFPTPTSAHNTSQAIRIFYYLKPTEYSAVGDTVSYPESLDYRILGWRTAANYKRSLSDFDSAIAFDLEYEKRVKQLIATLSRGSQQPLKATGLGLTGWEF